FSSVSACRSVRPESSFEPLLISRVPESKIETELALAGIAALVGLGILIAIARHVSRPIQRITQSMQEIADGETDKAIP
ncbi:HAMP domain-containing protein, partial [Rhizobium ruizarguesonis]